MRTRTLIESPLVVAFSVLAFFGGLNSARTAAQSAAALTPPVQLTADQDRQRTLDLLHITALRAPRPTNYDESQANPYPVLPDPLILNNGKRVTSAKVWWQQRRPQLVEMFDREVYGRMPANTPKVTWKVESTSKEMVGTVPVITKKLVGQVDNSSYPLVSVNIDLVLTTPANATGPVPVILELDFFRTPPVAIAGAMGAAPGPEAAGPTWQQQVLAQGWGYASVIPPSIQPDSAAGLTQGIIGMVNKGQPRQKPDEWGGLRAWAWGASRILDYFESDPSVDARQVGITGHSRYGKASLLAMAYDPRFAIAYASSSGEGGAKLNRRYFGETVENLDSGLYYWMAPNFLKYAGSLQWNDLPVDAHELIALCAPRPVFIGGGSVQGDGWADPEGMFMAAAAAGPVYQLLGKHDMGTTTFPPIETPLIDGDVAFRQHTGGHTPTPNWPTFIRFASRYLHAPPAAANAASGPAQP